MNLQALLCDKPCECGKTHHCSIKHVIIESGAVQKVGSLLGDYKKILLVADNNTYKTCGKEVEAQMDLFIVNRTADMLKAQITGSVGSHPPCAFQAKSGGGSLSR